MDNCSCTLYIYVGNTELCRTDEQSLFQIRMTEKKPFHVSGLEPTKMKVLGVNIFPLITKMTRLMSDETRRKQMTKKVAAHNNFLLNFIPFSF